MKLKWINRYDELAKRRRICTLTGCKGTVGDGKGYSWKLTLSLCDKPLYTNRNQYSYVLTGRREYALGRIMLSYSRSYGGIYA